MRSTRVLHLCESVIIWERRVVNSAPLRSVLHRLHLRLFVTVLVVHWLVLFARTGSQRRDRVSSVITCAGRWMCVQLQSPSLTVSFGLRATPAERGCQRTRRPWPPRTRWATEGCWGRPALPGWEWSRWTPECYRSAERRCWCDSWTFCWKNV